jgi:hypothetical protein
MVVIFPALLQCRIQISHGSVCIASAPPLTAKIRISAAQFQPY